jgi:hypothetical protein
MGKPTPDQVNRELEVARLAIVSLIAVMTAEQLRSVETGLEALAPMHDRGRAALEEIRAARQGRRPEDGPDEETRDAIEAHLATLDTAP